MVAWMIDEYGSEELRERFVPALASMEVSIEYFTLFSKFLKGFNFFM